ncbi:hypothetical protein ACIP5N_33975 [Streptomyces sp. NPDC088768]|uniref:hypothetical protein n=1 Tax=Streptomyces sp. NPDC088768 TaxID=3365894 RepID=UPI003806A501
MSTRQFTVSELDDLGVPPHRPEDVEDSDTLLADEHVTTLKYTQQRRVIFAAPDDGRTYAVEYESQLNLGHFELGDPPPDHGWYGDTVEAVEVKPVPTLAICWEPVDVEPGPDRPRPDALNSLVALWVEAGASTSDAREAAAAWIVEHGAEVANAYDEYQDSAEGDL